MAAAVVTSLPTLRRFFLSILTWLNVQDKAQLWEDVKVHLLNDKEAETENDVLHSLQQMLHEVVLPNAKRDDSALFKEKLANDKPMQAALEAMDDKLRVWFDVHTQSMKLQGKGRKLQFQQWQDLLKNRDDPGQNLVGQWSSSNAGQMPLVSQSLTAPSLEHVELSLIHI